MLVAVCLLACGAYLLQLATPLRLDQDASIYLLVADSVAEGEGFRYFGGESPFPPGYPLAIAALLWIGLGSSAGIVALNLIGALGGAYLLLRVLQRDRNVGTAGAWFCTSIFLWSWLLIKHATLPVSESLFVGCSSLSLLFLSSRPKDRRWIFLFLGIAFAAVAIQIRTIGIALIPAILVSAVPPVSKLGEWLFGSRRRLGLAILATVGGGAVVLGAIAQTPYVDQFFSMYERMGGAIPGTLFVLLCRLQDFGQLAVNLPLSALGSMGGYVVVPAGFALVALCLLGLYLRRRVWAPWDAYAATYLTVLFLWPFSNPRFLLPVIPFLAAWALTAVTPALSHRWARVLFAVAFSLFLLTGAAAFTYSTRLSLSGDRFPDLYGRDGVLRATYRYAFHGTPAGENETVEKLHLEALRKFEARARAMPSSPQPQSGSGPATEE